MPVEKRCPNSGAKLFVPTTSERSLLERQRRLNEGLKEVENMKSELQELIDKLKEE